MAPLAYIYNATNNQQIESKSRGPKQLARKPFDQWLAGPRLRKYPSLPGLTDVDWPKLCEQLAAGRCAQLQRLGYDNRRLYQRAPGLFAARPEF